MRTQLILLTLILFTLISKGQYPFEKYPCVKYLKYSDWKIYDNIGKENKINSSLTIPNFFDNNDSITIHLTSFPNDSLATFTDNLLDSSIIHIFHNKIEIQTIIEDMIFNPKGLDTLRIADINGDGLMDIKIVSAFVHLGEIALNARVIYLFQQPDHSFTKISFHDFYNYNRPERDFDGDGNYEIIALAKSFGDKYEDWVFNIFDYKNNGLVNVNFKDNFPIKIQFFYGANFKIKKKITIEKAKDVELNLPNTYDKK
jgi:hypothetical protein